MTDSIIITLMDDESTNVTPYMSQAVDLASDGIVFSNHFISSPVCSPSRASLMKGQYPHNTGVIANDWPRGGYGKYGSIEDDSIFTRMQAAGFYTVLAGKIQNHYAPEGNANPSNGFTYAALHVPPGIDDALLLDENGYPQWKWKATQKIAGVTTLVDYSGSGYDQTTYANRKIFAFAVASIVRAVAAGKPIFMLICPFSVHSGNAGKDPEGLKFHPDPLDRKVTADRPVGWDAALFTNGNCGGGGDGGCSLVTNPGNGDESFNVPVVNATAWHRTTPFGSSELASMLESHKNRVRMAQGVNRGIIDVRAQLTTSGIAASTHVVLTSDNGFHFGEKCMPQAKSSPYDCDTRLTLIWRPPGGTTPVTYGDPYIVQNVDYMPTCLDIAGEAEDVDLDGRSLLPFIDGTPPDPEDWRHTALIEFTTDGPDFDDCAGTGKAPTSRTLRDANYLFPNFWYTNFGVPMGAGAPPTAYAETYVLDEDPWSTVNRYGDASQESRDEMFAMLDAALSAEGQDLWDVLLQPIPTLDLGGGGPEEPESDEQFLVDGFDMSVFAREIHTADPRTAPLRGENLVVPHRTGRIPLIEQLPDENDFDLEMWAAGADAFGRIPPGVEGRALCRAQLDTISRIFTTGGRREIRKRFDTNWRAVQDAAVVGSINFNMFDERVARHTVRINAPEGSWRDISTRTDLVDFDPTLDEVTGRWSQDLWFLSFAGSTAPLQDYILELYGLIKNPTWENIGPGLGRRVEYKQNIGAPARLTVDTQAVTAIFDQPEDLTFDPFDDFEQIARPYGCFPILWPRASDGAYGLRVTSSEEPGRGAQVALTGYRRYQLRG